MTQGLAAGLLVLSLSAMQAPERPSSPYQMVETRSINGEPVRCNTLYWERCGTSKSSGSEACDFGGLRCVVNGEPIECETEYWEKCGDSVTSGSEVCD
jgi:hypothetical protein